METRTARGPVENAMRRSSFTVLTAGAMQETGEATERMLNEITGHLCTPIDGAPGESVGFLCKWDRRGYRMAYHVVGDADRPSAKVVVDWMERDEAYDEDLDGADPAITFDTCREYEEQCDRCTQDGLDQAARAMWDAVRDACEEWWGFEESLRDRGNKKGARSHNRRLAITLDAYAQMFDALGCRLSYAQDWTDPCEHVWEVRVSSTGGASVSGCLRSWAKPNW